MSKVFVGVGVALAALVGIYVAQSSMSGQSEAQTALVTEAVMKEESVTVKADEPMMTDTKKGMHHKSGEMVDPATEGDAVGVDKEKMIAETTAEGETVLPGVYVSYEAGKLALAKEGDVVLFFRASWCPGCRALDASINSSLSVIPSGLTILDVNYDTETALKQKYGVTTQHTLVQVAADGTLIKKWSGGSTLASIIGQVQ